MIIILSVDIYIYVLLVSTAMFTSMCEVHGLLIAVVSLCSQQGLR